jgi:hypothetical protein
MGQRRSAVKIGQRDLFKEGSIMLPKDPVMLLSTVNMKLRDFYGSLEALCQDLDVDQSEIERTLEVIDYRYDKERNQFV